MVSSPDHDASSVALYAKRFKTVFKSELVLVGLRAETREQAIMDLAELLTQHGYVTDTFPQAVLDREAELPTGLPTRPVAVALPHTDSEYVLMTGIAVGILAQPVTFGEMGKPGQCVEAGLIFLLAIKEPDEQIHTLQELVELFHKPHVLEKLLQAGDARQVIGLIRESYSG